MYYNERLLMDIPEFPEFKPIEIGDRDALHDRLWAYQPTNSELTFTNLFIWRNHYGFAWSIYKDWLVILGSDPDGEPYVLTPIGPPDRLPVVETLLAWLKHEKGVYRPAVERADQRLVSELQGIPHFVIEPLRDHFDYVYRTEDLIQLAGGSFRAKRNHINYFLRSYNCSYEPLDGAHKQACLDLMETWCVLRRCEDDLSLSSEWEAIREALANFEELNVVGGVLLVHDKVEAFTIGELLNRETVVVHIEKANMEIRGLYAMINQQFCEKEWQGVLYVNREQDLGEPGLREAKLSYNPDHFVEKFRIRLSEA
ncbi:MAG: phosphatidylglycerol lysyltransferase domain-containing protein [Syntrophorhabdales bacterium]